MHKIEFEHDSEFANLTNNFPVPASKALPKWLKDLHRFPTKKMEPNGSGGVSQTIKACPPFLDAMMTGYIIKTEFDLLVTLENGEHTFHWNSGGSLIEQHAKTQIDPSQVPNGFSGQPWKFTNFYRIKTPKGYSALFLHPLNREDLPFRTIAGVVDTDNYDLEVNFPFFIRADFKGIIPAGTPIVQVVPIKRDKWESSLSKALKDARSKATVLLKHKMMSAYKTLYWQRKEYK